MEQVCIRTGWSLYREVQLDSTPEIEVFQLLFDRCHSKTRKRSIKQHIKYFKFRSFVQLDQPVVRGATFTVGIVPPTAKRRMMWGIGMVVIYRVIHVL